MSISLKNDFAVVGQLEVEIVTARLKIVEEDCMRRFDRSIVQNDEDPSISWILWIEGLSEGKERENGEA